MIGDPLAAALPRRAADRHSGVDIVGLASGLVRYQGVVSLPPSIAPTFLQFDIAGALQPAMLPVIFVFFFLALFDSVGTLVGVATRPA